MASTSVYIIDDDEAVLDSLGMFLEQQGLRVHRYTRAGPFLDALYTVSGTACIVSDVRMPDLSGLDLQRELLRRASTLPLILITGHGDIDMAVAAVKAGAHDFLEKPFNEWRLLASIRSATVSMQRDAERSEERTSHLRRHAELSDRQQQVMALAVKGRTNKEIGAELGISPRTVEIYRARVMERMGAATLADLVRIAIAIDERR